MLKKLSILSLISVFCLSAAFIGKVQTASADLTRRNTWGGTWVSTSGESTIYVSEKDGFIDVIGKDAASVYTCTGIIETTPEKKVQEKVKSQGYEIKVQKNFAECIGSGRNDENRFIYKSRFEINFMSIEETWEATFADGKVWTGESTFKKKQKKEENTR